MLRGAPVLARVEQAAARAGCDGLLARALAAPELPGAPGLEAARAELLARGKGEPVSFSRAPKPTEPPSAEVSILRAEIAASPAPGYSLARMYSRLTNRPEVARELLLREGYLYAESPSLAAALVEHVELHHLFRDKPVIIERGSERIRAVKGKSYFYVYDGGPEPGARARVLLFDRLWPEGTDPGPPLHLELRQLAVQLGFDRMRVVRATERGIVAELRYGRSWTRALLRAAGSRAELVCERVPDAARGDVAWVRQLAERKQRVLAAKRAAILAQIEEALPFDEPITEDGQQDGNLRPAWTWAYKHGWDSYEFNDDFYRVFDAAGRPKVPQVCIDFITDTLERASGTWWRRQEEQRERLQGRLDFDQLAIENRRSVDVFVRFAKSHPEWFDVHDLALESRVPFIERERFFGYLREHADAYLPGDIVVIHGPRSDGEMHYHSFWIYDSDPLTGMPTLVASNAGRPRIRTWEFEMRAAPRRSIKHRIRPRLPWLESVVVSDERTVRGPAPLASAPI